MPKPNETDHYLINITNGNLYDKCYMTVEKGMERNEWLDKYGSKNIKWHLEYEMDRLYRELGMLPQLAKNTEGWYV